MIPFSDSCSELYPSAARACSKCGTEFKRKRKSMEDRVPKGKTNVSDQKEIIHGRVTYLCFSLFIIINQKII